MLKEDLDFENIEELFGFPNELIDYNTAELFTLINATFPSISAPL